MITGILLVVLAGCIWSFCGIANSYCARFNLNITTYLFSNTACSCLLAGIFVVQYGNLHQAPVLPLCVLLIPAGVFNTGGAVLLQYALKRGHHGIVFLICQSAMIVPLLSGVIFFGEKLSLMQGIGCCSIFCGMFCCAVPKLSVKKADSASAGNGSAEGKKSGFLHAFLWLILAICSFSSYGIAQTLMTVPSWIGVKDPAQMRTMLLYFGSTLLMTCFGLTSGTKLQFNKKLILLGIICSILSLSSTTILFRALDFLSVHRLSSLGFPLAVATSLVGFTLYSLLIMKEKCYKMTMLGLFLIITGGILNGF
ncbi:MAG: DMT family transporter [Lentisphaeria bacterium]|nr:DMT family transporter [Lentisphaeria bacterium]